MIPTNETLYTTNEHKSEFRQNIQIPSVVGKNQSKVVPYTKQDEIEENYYKSIINECQRNKNMKVDNNDLELEGNISFEDDNSMLNHSIKNLFSKIKLHSNGNKQF